MGKKPKKKEKIPKKSSEKKAKMGRPTVFTPAKKALMLQAIEDGLTRNYAAQLVGIHPETLRLHLQKDSSFLDEIRVSEASAIYGLIPLVKEQNGAWKLLKNLGKESYRDIIDIGFDESKPLTIKGQDGESEEI